MITEAVGNITFAKRQHEDLKRWTHRASSGSGSGWFILGLWWCLGMCLGPILEHHNVFQWDGVAAAATATATWRSVCLCPYGTVTFDCISRLWSFLSTGVNCTIEMHWTYLFESSIIQEKLNVTKSTFHFHHRFIEVIDRRPFLQLAVGEILWQKTELLSLKIYNLTHHNRPPCGLSHSRHGN